MKQWLIIIVIIFLWEVSTLAEMVVDTSWVRRYNGPGNGEDSPTDMIIDQVGNIYVTGGSWGTPLGYNIATIKYNLHGDTIWLRRYAGGETARSIAKDILGNICVTGEDYSNATENDYVTVKYYPNGDTAWARMYNGSGNGSCDYPCAIAIDSTNSIYVTGKSKASFFEDYDYATIKYYPNGDTAWVRRYNGPGNGNDVARAMAIDGYGNVYVVGSSYGGETSNDFATIKYDTNGNELWVRRYNGSGNMGDVSHALAIDGSYNVYVAGESFGYGSWEDYTTIKYLSNGDTVWIRTYNGPLNGYDGIEAITVNASGNIIVTGYSRGTGGDDDFITIKYDSLGNELWSRRYNGPGNQYDIPYAIITDDSDNIYITGTSYGIGSGGDYATIKYDSSGNELWARKYNGPGNGIDEAHGLVVDNYNNVYVTGWSYGSGTDFDYTTLKYSEALRGDTDRDGVIDLHDVVYLINYLYMNGYAPEPVEAGNTNCDGMVDVGDIIYLINYTLKGGPEPSCI